MWGRQQGPEPQRTDLWVADFSDALKKLTVAVNSGSPLTPGVTAPTIPSYLFTYFCSAISLPELRIRADAIRRDSRPYNMPAWDDPLDPIRMQFILDCYKPGATAQSPYTSDIYQLLDAWRAVVRAGRGALSNEFSLTLNSNFSMDYAYDVRLNMMRGDTPSLMNLTALSNATFIPGVFGQAIRASASGSIARGFAIQNDLQYSTQLRLANCWLSSFKLSDFNYEGAKVTTIDATFYAENVERLT